MPHIGVDSGFPQPYPSPQLPFMHRSRAIRAFLLILAVALAFGLLLPAPPSSADLSVSAQILPDIGLRLSYSNSGSRVLVVRGLCLVEAAAKEFPPVHLSLPFSAELLPGESRKCLLPPPNLGEHTFRIGVWAREVLPAWREQGREWLIKLGIEERRATSRRYYSDWVPSQTRPQPYPVPTDTSAPSGSKRPLPADSPRDPKASIAPEPP